VEAEKQIRRVLDGAKSGQVQKIADAEGCFEIRYIPILQKEAAGKYLARGGPLDED
jgi:hypothetical protein